MLDNREKDCNEISVSKSSSMEPNQHRHFYPLKINSMQQLADVMQHKIWSPIVWKDGVRLKDNFLSARYIALDFDDGRLTVAEAIKLCEMSRLAYIIGTSKSHQKEKRTITGKIQPAVDRFRLVYKVDAQTTDKDLYEYNMTELMGLYPCDPSCKDAARFFYGCKQIVAVKEGSSLTWKTIPENLLTGSARTHKMHERYAEYREKKMLPAWVLSALRWGADPGGRHKLCYRLGATLIHLGYSENQIVQLCKDSPLGAIGDEDVERAVLNGADAAITEYDEYLRQRSQTGNERPPCQEGKEKALEKN